MTSPSSPIVRSSQVPQATKHWTNDLGDPTKHPLYEKFNGKPGAQRAFVSLCTRQVDTDGRTSPNGIVLPVLLVGTMTEETMLENNGVPEAAFARPYGFLNIHRSFFPDIKNSTKLMPTFAGKHIDTANKSIAEIATLNSDMLEFMQQFLHVMGELSNSKLQCAIIGELQDNPIKFADNQVVSDIETLKKRWKREIPDEPIAKAVFDLLFKFMDVRKFHSLCFKICCEQHIWFPCSSNEKDMSNRGNKAVGPKRTILGSLMKARYRDNYRKTIMTAPHGLVLNVNNVGHPKGKPRVFDYQKHLVGWENKKYLLWKQISQVRFTMYIPF